MMLTTSNPLELLDAFTICTDVMVTGASMLQGYNEQLLPAREQLCGA